VWPPDSKSDAIPDDATVRKIKPSNLNQLIIVCHKNVFPVPPWIWTKISSCQTLVDIDWVVEKLTNADI
jgi:hypothetical protein